MGWGLKLWVPSGSGGFCGWREGGNGKVAADDVAQPASTGDAGWGFAALGGPGAGGEPANPAGSLSLCRRTSHRPGKTLGRSMHKWQAMSSTRLGSALCQETWIVQPKLYHLDLMVQHQELEQKSVQEGLNSVNQPAGLLSNISRMSSFSKTCPTVLHSLVIGPNRSWHVGSVRQAEQFGAHQIASHGLPDTACY